MISLTSKLRKEEGPRYNEFQFYCPGCKDIHSFRVLKAGMEAYKGVPAWTMTGTAESPTFEPSLFYTKRICHLYVRNGVIEYLPDSTHDLKGQKIPMMDFPEGI